MAEFLRIGAAVAGKVAMDNLKSSRVPDGSDSDVKIPKKSLAKPRARSRASQLPKKLKAPASEPVAPVVPDAPDPVLPVTPSPSQTLNPGIQNANEQNLLRLRQLEEEERFIQEDEPVAPITTVNATELQNDKTQPTDAEIEAVQKEKESYVSGEVFAEQILEERDAQKKDSVSLISQSNDTSRSSLDAVEAFVAQPRISEAIAQGVEVKTKDDTWATFTESVRGKKSVVLVSPGQKELLRITLIGDEWLDSKGNRIDDAAIREKLQNNWRLLNEEEEKAFEMGKGIDQVMETKESGKLENEKREFRAQIKSLEGELEELRAKYVKKDYEETSAWKRISRILGRNLEPSSDIDEKAKYQEKLQELLDARLTLAKLGKEGDALKDAMAGELQYFMTESKIKLYDARTEVKGTGYLEKVGNYYNDLVRKHPWVSAGIGLTLLGAGFASGGAAPATLTLAVFLKRAIATPGLFVTTDSILGGASAWFRDRGIKKDVDKESQKTPEEIERFIKAMNADCDKSLLQCKVAGRVQKLIAALAAGLLFGHTAIAAYEHLTGGGIVDKVASAQAMSPEKAVEMKASTDATMAAAENVGQVPAPGSGTIAREQLTKALQGGVDGKPDVPPISPSVAEAAKNAVGVPSGVGDNIYEVSKGDTVDGLIGSYLSEHYQNFDGMTDGQKTHAINALERQLKHLSPEQLKLAGIGSRNIHSIQVKELVDLDKLFSTEDADRVMGKAANISAAAQHSIEQNNEAIAKWAVAHPGVPINEVTIENQILHPHAGVASEVAHGSRVQLPPQGFTGVPADYYAPSIENSTPTPGVSAESISPPVSPAEAPFERPSLTEMRRGSDWFMQIFRVDDQSLGGANKDWVFDKKEILSTKMTDVLRVGGNGSVSISPDSHLSFEQSKNLQEFATSLPKAFPGGQAALGDFLKARPNISVGEYLARVAKVVPQGTRIGLYTTTN